MELKEIYKPISKDLERIEEIIRSSLKNSHHSSLKKLSNYILKSGGKRIRAALVVLSAKATLDNRNSLVNGSYSTLLKISSAIELIHLASLIHDDVIDKAKFRHSRLTVNYHWGDDVSIALGNYLYSLAFKLIAETNHPKILSCLSAAGKAMCEGELLQIWERGNFNLSRKKYFIIVKKKTASLFSACCEAGCLLASAGQRIVDNLKEYGLKFGIAFQIVDDYLDLMGDSKKLGKDTGQDIKRGELTLPIMYLWGRCPSEEKERIKKLFLSSPHLALKEVRRNFNCWAQEMTKEEVSLFITSAKNRINTLYSSPYKDSLLNLADFVRGRIELERN